MMKNRNNKGFTLIEVLIAVIVFSFGLLGVAGVMTVAVKNNHNGYLRSQAAFLASSIIDSMRRNQLALWSNAYNGVFSGYNDISALCTAEAGCTSANLVTRDIQQWSNMITQLLPNSSGTIACDNGGIAPASAIPVMIDDPDNPGTEIVCAHCAIEPYNGFCNVTITWDESNSNSVSSTQTLELVGKP